MLSAQEPGCACVLSLGCESSVSVCHPFCHPVVVHEQQPFKHTIAFYPRFLLPHTHTHPHTDTHTNTPTHPQTQTHTQTLRHTHKHPQTHTHTHRHIHTHPPIHTRFACDCPTMSSLVQPWGNAHRVQRQQAGFAKAASKGTTAQEAEAQKQQAKSSQSKVVIVKKRKKKASNTKQ